MKAVAWALAALSAVVTLGCQVPPKPPPPTAPPVITTFTVDNARITKGQAVSFAFATERARSVTLLDQGGASVPVTFDEAAGTGTATATPSATSFYVLRAEGDGGRDAAYLQVAVDEGLKSVFLVAVPREIKAGEHVDLIWSAPGGTNVTVTAGARSLGTGETGNASDEPATTTTYRLSAGKLDGTTMTMDVTVKVAPVIETFEVNPAAARVGEKLTLSWRTRGGESLALEEATFGQLLASSTAVDQGTFDFTVPAYFGDAGVPDDAGVADAGAADGGPGPLLPVVRDGFPLRFTLTVRTATPAQSIARAVDGRVGQGPIIDQFLAPASATRGVPQTLSWQTTGATRVELWADGLRVFAPPAGSQVDGSYALPGLSADTTFTLVAYDFAGASSSRTVTTRLVQPPAVTSFTVTASVSGPTSPITATWQTANASTVVVRVKDGPTVHFTDVQNLVNAGTAPVRAGQRTTFVLEARNAAGDTATREATANVSAPVRITVTPEPSAAGAALTAAWDVSSLGPVDLPGLPSSPPQLTASGTRFDDLDTVPAATRLFFTDPDEGVATFTAPSGFAFPFVTGTHRTFTVSTNGFVAPDGAAPLPTNADLGAAGYAGPAMIAPFWDDIDLGTTGSVKYFVSGQAFPRTLIIQWSKVQLYGVAGTELTFQVQLTETGKLLFAYKTLTGTDTDGASASIGVIESRDTFYHSRSFNTGGALTAGDELLWFGNDASRLTSNWQLKLPRSKSFGFFVETGNAELIPVRGSARVFAASTVVVNEAMPVPDSTLTAGQWVELYNPSPAPVDIGDLQLVATSAATAPFTIPQGTTIDGGAYLVLGQSTDAQANGGANVALAWGTTDLPFTDTDGVTLQVPGATPFPISALSWVPAAADGGTGVTAGLSAQAPERAITASGPLSCPRTKTFGPLTQTGSPGAENEVCFEYRLDRIPVAYEDISALGQPVVTGSFDSAIYRVDLPAPFSYFGASTSSLWISTNGFVTTAAQTQVGTTNRATPSSTSAPVGAIAPFWDDLDEDGLPGAQIFFARRSGYSIVQWHRYSHWLAGDDLNFQIKLMDSGVIEFHYATMSSGSTSNYGTGTSATAWIERPSGTAAALPVSVNQPSISPNTAWRFTPNP